MTCFFLLLIDEYLAIGNYIHLNELVNWRTQRPQFHVAVMVYEALSWLMKTMYDCIDTNIYTGKKWCVVFVDRLVSLFNSNIGSEYIL